MALPETLVPPLRWYALRVTYCRELKLKAWFDEQSVDHFIPMRYQVVTKGNRSVRCLVPAVHNLLFVRVTRRFLDELCMRQDLPVAVHCILDRETRRPIVIPDNQMRNFIAVAGNYDQSLLYVDPMEIHLEQGTRVRITGGIFQGVEGVFVRFRRDRRVVVSIQGVMAVATTFVPPSMVEPIES